MLRLVTPEYSLDDRISLGHLLRRFPAVPRSRVLPAVPRSRVLADIRAGRLVAVSTAKPLAFTTDAVLRWKAEWLLTVISPDAESAPVTLHGRDAAILMLLEIE